MGLLSNKIKREELNAGDHIYSWRNAYVYAHHGIYVGNGMVVHFTPGGGQEIGTGTVVDRVIFSSFPVRPSNDPCPWCGANLKDDGVIISCIDCFLSGGELYLFEYDASLGLFVAKVRGGTCTLAKSDQAEDVVRRATFLLQNGFGVYDLFKNNCEDFAIYCKTGLLGVGRSGQAASFEAVVKAVVSSSLPSLTASYCGLVAVGFGLYCVKRLVSDIGVRRDVFKVPVEMLVAYKSLPVRQEDSKFKILFPFYQLFEGLKGRGKINIS